MKTTLLALAILTSSITLCAAEGTLMMSKHGIRTTIGIPAHLDVDSDTARALLLTLEKYDDHVTIVRSRRHVIYNFPAAPTVGALKKLLEGKS